MKLDINDKFSISTSLSELLCLSNSVSIEFESIESEYF